MLLVLLEIPWAALGQHMGKDTVVVYLLSRGKFKAIAVCSSDGSSGSTTTTTSTTASTSTDASTSGSSIPDLVSSFLAKRSFLGEISEGYS